jgi:phenylpyruvate tautomerase PptA (4-oxalocrotonate tautomerase family)
LGRFLQHALRQRLDTEAQIRDGSAGRAWPDGYLPDLARGRLTPIFSAADDPAARRSLSTLIGPQDRKELTMPLTRVSLLKGKPPEYRRAILDGLYQAMRETFGVPEDDRFMLIEEHDEANFLYGKIYLGIERDNDLVVIQITVNNTRGLEQKKALFASIAGILAESPGIRPENILINLLEVPKENWSFGNGIAQYA